MIVSKIIELPSQVEFQGVVFDFELFINHSDELRFVYKISYVTEQSKHYKDYCDAESELHEKWTPPHGGANNWLYLAEGIESDDYLIAAIDDCKQYLKDLGVHE